MSVDKQVSDRYNPLRVTKPVLMLMTQIGNRRNEDRVIKLGGAPKFATVEVVNRPPDCAEKLPHRNRCGL